MKVEEFWMPVSGYEGLYAVSDKGRVKSLPRLEEARLPCGKTIIKRRAGRFLAVYSLSVYPTVRVCKNSVPKTLTVHRIVLESFTPSFRGEEVNHKNGDKSDNSLSNLEWSDRRHNSLHSTQVLKKNRGEQQHLCKLKEKDIPEIVAKIKSGASLQEIGDTYGVSRYAISLIKHGKSWSWLSGYHRKER